jgi:DNA-binding NtrC family response regulator/tetratricopeptide (TPR) repeat protein
MNSAVSTVATPPDMTRPLDDGDYACLSRDTRDLATGDRLDFPAVELSQPVGPSADAPSAVLAHGRGDEPHEHTRPFIARPNEDLQAAQTACLDVAARSPRPHVQLSLSRAGAGTCRAPWMVREARAAYAPASPTSPGDGKPDGATRDPGPLSSKPGEGRRPSVPVTTIAGATMRLVERSQRAHDLVRRGRHAAAIRTLREAATVLARRGAFAAAADTWITLGRFLLERGRTADAERAFAAATADAARAGVPNALTSARLWQAAARTDAGQLTAAEALARGVLVGGGLADLQRAQAAATLGRVFLWQGRHQEASMLLSEMTASDDPFVGAVRVRVHLACGRPFEAGIEAQTLLSLDAVGEDAISQLIVYTAHLRVLLAAGELKLGRERLETIRVAARPMRAPLRLARAQLLWVQALNRAGLAAEAAREGTYLRRIRAVAPPLLRRAIDQALRSDSCPTCPAVADVDAAKMVTTSHTEDDDPAAIAKVLEMVARAARASRIDLWSADAEAVTTVASVGTGPKTRLGRHVLEAGMIVGPEASDGGTELGVPVRVGSRLVAALVLRWPANQPAPSNVAAMSDLAAAVIAPRVDAVLARGREAAAAAAAIPELIGVSRAMADVRKAIVRAAASPFPVFIEGESGVGKELVARAIHTLSPRRQRRFCDVNCAALPDELLESELFGHARGAFTGAVTERRGLMEEADGGTLFLDEVAELSLRAQAKLLRAIQQQEIRRVGETFTRTVDVRVVCAANRDVRAEAAAGRFRQDLLYRLDVIRIRIPPLRERPEDVPVLARHFWTVAAERVGSAAVLSQAVLVALARHDWPGNVRELQNVLAALLVAAPPRGVVRASLLPKALVGATKAAMRLDEARVQFERRFVEAALARACGSRARAARDLGLSRQGLLKLMARLGIGDAAAEPGERTTRGRADTGES